MQGTTKNLYTASQQWAKARRTSGSGPWRRRTRSAAPTPPRPRSGRWTSARRASPRTAERLREKVLDLQADLDRARERLGELHAEKAELECQLAVAREALAGREQRIAELVAAGPGLEPAEQPGENDPPAAPEPDAPVVVPAAPADRRLSRRERLRGVAA